MSWYVLHEGTNDDVLLHSYAAASAPAEPWGLTAWASVEAQMDHPNTGLSSS